VILVRVRGGGNRVLCGEGGVRRGFLVERRRRNFRGGASGKGPPGCGWGVKTVKYCTRSTRDLTVGRRGWGKSSLGCQ